jgi:F0F1-type ATP synthase assembly protein I
LTRPDDKPAERLMWQGMGEAWATLSTLISGIAVWGGVGYLIDRLVGTWPGFFAGGVILGNFGACYLIYKKAVAQEAHHAP